MRTNQSESIKNQLHDQGKSYGTFPMPQETFETMSPDVISPKTTFSRDNEQMNTYKTPSSDIGFNSGFGYSRYSAKSVVQPATSARTDKSPQYKPAWNRYIQTNNQSHNLKERH